ncbi:MAG: cytochrome c oxidase subunit [Bryobacterales bacterium]|jgi:cytochrome c oxidase subunit 3|nr:cytochrome c oxidase subunit [Bryobacterales bacterium]
MITEIEHHRGGARSAAFIGIVVLMCASAMTFSALVSAMVVRRGLNATDWHRISLPHILWWNTGILLLSSVAIDLARRLLRRGKRTEFNYAWTAGTVLGTLFLIGQVVAWNQVAGDGFRLQHSLSAAFFYVLTWAHAAHVVGALGAVGYVEYRAVRYQLGPANRTVVDVSAMFWHFLDVLWLGLMALFAFWS